MCFRKPHRLPPKLAVITVRATIRRTCLAVGGAILISLPFSAATAGAAGAPTATGVAALATTPDSTAARRILDKIVADYRALTGLKVKFTQNITSTLTGSVGESKGELLRSSPSLYSINFSDPDTDRIVSDGKYLWVYLPSSAPNQVIRVELKKGSAPNIADPIDMLFGEGAQDFRVSKLKSQGKTAVIRLAPVERGNQLRSATIWIEEGARFPSKIETVEASGIKRTIQITAFTPNVKLPASAFKFVPAKGVRVIDQ